MSNPNTWPREPNNWPRADVKLEGLTPEQQVGLDMYMADHPEADFSNHSLMPTSSRATVLSGDLP